MSDAMEAYACLDRVLTGSYRPSDLSGAIAYMKANYPVQHDQLISLLAGTKMAIADSILHRQLLEDDADRRQTRLDI